MTSMTNTEKLNSRTFSKIPNHPVPIGCRASITADARDIG